MYDIVEALDLSASYQDRQLCRKPEDFTSFSSEMMMLRRNYILDDGTYRTTTLWLSMSLLPSFKQKREFIPISNQLSNGLCHQLKHPTCPHPEASGEGCNTTTALGSIRKPQRLTAPAAPRYHFLKHAYKQRFLRRNGLCHRSDRQHSLALMCEPYLVLAS